MDPAENVSSRLRQELYDPDCLDRHPPSRTKCGGMRIMQAPDARRLVDFHECAKSFAVRWSILVQAADLAPGDSTSSNRGFDTGFPSTSSMPFAI